MTTRTFGAALLFLLPLVAAAQSGAPVLKDRNGNPISEPPTIASQPESASTVAASAATSAPMPSAALSVAPNVVQEGSTMIVRLDDTLDTRKLQPGKHFKAKLAEDMVGPTGAVLVPRGKKIKGHVSLVDHGMHARMVLGFDEIDTPHGWMPLIARVNDVPGDRAVDKVGEEGDITRKAVSKRRAIESAAAGAAIGATTGAVAGGSKGAGIGAGAGAGLGAMAGILSDREMRLEKGQQLELKLDRDLRVPTH